MTFSGIELALILVLVPVVVMFVWALADLIRHDALPNNRKAIWLLGIFVLPLVGPLLYLIFRPLKRADIRGIGTERPQTERSQDLMGEDD